MGGGAGKWLFLAETTVLFKTNFYIRCTMIL
jgi:hypothetical protein